MANTKLNTQDGARVSMLLTLAQLVQNYMADIASTCAQLVQNREQTSNKVTSITSNSTNDEYPSAKAVYELVHGIPNANEVSY